MGKMLASMPASKLPASPPKTANWRVARFITIARLDASGSEQVLLHGTLQTDPPGETSRKRFSNKKVINKNSINK